MFKKPMLYSLLVFFPHIAFAQHTLPQTQYQENVQIQTKWGKRTILVRNKLNKTDSDFNKLGNLSVVIDGQTIFSKQGVAFGTNFITAFYHQDEDRMEVIFHYAFFNGKYDLYNGHHQIVVEENLQVENNKDPKETFEISGRTKNQLESLPYNSRSILQYTYCDYDDDLVTNRIEFKVINDPENFSSSSSQTSINKSVVEVILVDAISGKKSILDMGDHTVRGIHFEKINVKVSKNDNQCIVTLQARKIVKKSSSLYEKDTFIPVSAKFIIPN